MKTIVIETYRDPHGKRISCSEWYNTHENAKPYRDRIMKAINQLRFRGLWHDMVEGVTDPIYAPDERQYRFVCDVRKLAGMPTMSKEMYEEGRIYRHIFAGNYEYGLKEMYFLCWGDW